MADHIIRTGLCSSVYYCSQRYQNQLYFGCQTQSYQNKVVQDLDTYRALRNQTTSMIRNEKVNTLHKLGSPVGDCSVCSLYVNDLPNVIEKCSIHIYADDTILYYSADSVKACEETVSMDMKRVVKWLNENKLLLHPDKTNSMLFGHPQKLRHAGTSANITDGVNVYKQVDSFTYLGITLDPSLRWAAHVHRITKKLLSGLGAMGRARAFVTKEVLCSMYQALLQPHLEYCATAWLPSLVLGNQTLMSQLDRLVNRAARLITGHKLQDHVSAVNLRAEAGIDSVRKRTEITTLVNVFNPT
ncbi:hypothetical protein Bbelb_025100 [Branchiostoma belcheri]|nr:hypothetical protein Bbelb_025100 [Branchiostoma belcheri]